MQGGMNVYSYYRFPCGCKLKLDKIGTKSLLIQGKSQEDAMEPG